MSPGEGTVKEPRHDVVGVALAEPVEVPQHPSPPNYGVTGLRGAHQHLDASIAAMRPECLARPVTCHALHPRCSAAECFRKSVRRLEHQRPRVGVQCHRVPLFEDASHDGGGIVDEVLVDDEERGPGLMLVRTSSSSGVAVGFGPSSRVR